MTRSEQQKLYWSCPERRKAHGRRIAEGLKRKRDSDPEFVAKQLASRQRTIRKLYANPTFKIRQAIGRETFFATASNQFWEKHAKILRERNSKHLKHLTKKERETFFMLRIKSRLSSKEAMKMVISERKIDYSK